MCVCVCVWWLCVQAKYQCQVKIFKFCYNLANLECSLMVSLPALLDDIGLTCTDMWSGNEIAVGRTNFTQFAEEFAFECGW